MNIRYYLFLVAVLFSACASWVAPHYTNVDRMLELKEGMNTEEVNKILGITPYNLLHKNDSSLIYEYHYRLKKKNLKKKPSKPIHIDNYQKNGRVLYYNPSKFYLLFKEGRFKTLITESGLKESEYLLIKKNNLLVVTDNDLPNYALNKEIPFIRKIQKSENNSSSSKYSNKLLYTNYNPYGEIGIKYAFGNKIGFYISTAYSVDNNKITFLTGGLTYSIFNKHSFYLGFGKGPSYNDYDHLLNLDANVSEFGVMINVKRNFLIDLGLGYNDPEGILWKLGFGIIF